MSTFIPSRQDAADAYFGPQQGYVSEATTEGPRFLPNTIVCSKGQAEECVRTLWKDKSYVAKRAGTAKIITTSNPNFDLWGYTYTDSVGNKIQHFVAETYWQWQAALQLTQNENNIVFNPETGSVYVTATEDRSVIESEIATLEAMIKTAQGTIASAEARIAVLKSQL